MSKAKKLTKAPISPDVTDPRFDAPDPPVPNRAHTEMKAEQNKQNKKSNG